MKRGRIPAPTGFVLPLIRLRVGALAGCQVPDLALGHEDRAGENKTKRSAPNLSQQELSDRLSAFGENFSLAVAAATPAAATEDDTPRS